MRKMSRAVLCAAHGEEADVTIAACYDRGEGAQARVEPKSTPRFLAFVVKL